MKSHLTLDTKILNKMDKMIASNMGVLLKSDNKYVLENFEPKYSIDMYCYTLYNLASSFNPNIKLYLNMSIFKFIKFKYIDKHRDVKWTLSKKYTNLYKTLSNDFKEKFPDEDVDYYYYNIYKLYYEKDKKDGKEEKEDETSIVD